MLKYILLTLLSLPAFAEKAPSTMKEFNKICPAPKACASITIAMESCKNKKANSCDHFVKEYRNLLPEYDCQRSADASVSGNYIVPAIWLCQNHEPLLRFLSKQKSKTARTLFASSELRKTLDGGLSEEFKKKSLRLEKKLKSKKQRKKHP